MQSNFDKASFRISVTRADIDAGVRRDCEECPIARAATRAAGVEARVGTEWVTLHTSPKQHFQMSDAVCNRLARFDETGKMVPFSFTVHRVGSVL